MNLSDARLWNWFKRSVTPLGHPKEPSLPPPDIFERRLDLHGMTTQAAFQATISYIEVAKRQGVSSVVIVTGKSGTIREEFLFWVHCNENVARCELLPSDGAFRVILR